MTDDDVFSYLGYLIYKHDTRYYATTIDGTHVVGTPDELVDLIDSFLLKEM